MSDRPVHASGPVDLNLLRTFLTVYRSGSFTGAAQVLGLSQSTVTTQIRSLEDRLGRELFERRARGVTPLPFSEELAAQLAVPLDRLTSVADQGVERPPAPVHLAGPAELTGALLLRVLAPLVADGVQLRITTGLTDPLLEELRVGRHDIVVATQRPRSRALVAEPLADEEFVLVAAPAWAERLAGREDVADALKDVPLIGYSSDLPIVRRYWRHVFGQRLTLPAAVTVPDLRGIITAVAAGAGWSVVPSYLCRTELTTGALRLLHRPADPPINTAYLVRRPGVSGNPHADLVRERLMEAGREWLGDHAC